MRTLLLLVLSSTASAFWAVDEQDNDLVKCDPDGTECRYSYDCCSNNCMANACGGTTCCMPNPKPPPTPAKPMAVVNGIIGFPGAELFNVTIGAPGSCDCMSHGCDGHTINGTEHYHGDQGCYYYAVGGGIIDGVHGTPCHTWRADYKSCDVYPGSTEGPCGRIVNASCTVDTTTTTITASIDMKCDTYNYEVCVASSLCCGGFKCLPANASSGSGQKLCCPDTGCIHDKLPARAK